MMHDPSNPGKSKEKQALNYAMRLCSSRERCRQEILDKLEDAGLDPSQLDRILATLENEGFLNEARYATSFARDKLRINKWGSIKIRYQLVYKQIPENIIQEALDEINREDYLEILRGELLKKNRGIRAGNTYERRGRLYNFARQRGFETEEINLVLDELFK